MAEVAAKPSKLCEYCQSERSYSTRTFTANKGKILRLALCRGCARRVDDGEIKRSIL